jgi:GNAT superfamily N-acetyltransferase
VIRFELVNRTDHMDSIRELMEANWAETGFDFPFNPSARMYQAAVDAGVMFVIMAFDGDSIVGYCSMLVHPHLHNPAMIMASNDALYVDPAYRGITGARLIRNAEQEAARRGATRVMWHTRAGTKLHSAMARRGYKPADIVMMKEI